MRLCFTSRQKPRRGCAFRSHAQPLRGPLVGRGERRLSWSQGLAFLVTAARRPLRQQEPASPQGQRGARPRHAPGCGDEIPREATFVAAPPTGPQSLHMFRTSR